LKHEVQKHNTEMSFSMFRWPCISI